MAYQWIALGDETEDDATIKGKIKSNREQGKLIEEIKRGKKIHADVDIVDISDEDETTSLS